MDARSYIQYGSRSPQVWVSEGAHSRFGRLTGCDTDRDTDRDTDTLCWEHETQTCVPDFGNLSPREASTEGPNQRSYDEPQPQCNVQVKIGGQGQANCTVGFVAL